MLGRDLEVDGLAAVEATGAKVEAPLGHSGGGERDSR